MVQRPGCWLGSGYPLVVGIFRFFNFKIQNPSGSFLISKPPDRWPPRCGYTYVICVVSFSFFFYFIALYLYLLEWISPLLLLNLILVFLSAVFLWFGLWNFYFKFLWWSQCQYRNWSSGSLFRVDSFYGNRCFLSGCFDLHNQSNLLFCFCCLI